MFGCASVRLCVSCTTLISVPGDGKHKVIGEGNSDPLEAKFWEEHTLNFPRSFPQVLPAISEQGGASVKHTSHREHGSLGSVVDAIGQLPWRGC